MHFITYAKKVAAYRIEILLGVCISVTLVVIVLIMQSSKIVVQNDPQFPQDVVEEQKDEPITLAVEISGAVYKPGVYSLTVGSRLADLLEKAGGLNKQADKAFFFRNYNQARVLVDGEKVHAPSFEEISHGSFIEKPLIIYANKIGITEEVSEKSQAAGGDSGGLISIGSASISELEELPGVGKVTAEKIISARPYAAIDDLRSKGVVSESLFTKIQPLISL